jgi:hypothetical protein
MIIKKILSIKNVYGGLVFFSVTLLFACNNKKNINDQFSGLRNSNNLLLTIDQCKAKFTVYHDSVFLRSSNSPFTGSIEISGTIRFTDASGVFIEKQSTIALFNLKNGAFNGQQIYNVIYNGESLGSIASNNIFIKSEIPENWDIVKDVDYKVVNQNDPHNYSITQFGRPVYFQIIHLKEIKPIKTEIYWPNGNLLFELNYIFDFKNYLLSNENVFGYLKLLYTQQNSNITIFHYNGKIAYKGKLNSDGSPSSKGDFFNLDGSKSDSASFKLPLGVTGHETDFNTVFDGYFNIKDRSFKSYREYFSSDNPYLFKRKIITKDGIIHYPDAHESIAPDGSVTDTSAISNESKNNSNNLTVGDNIKRFSSDGLKYKTLIEIHFISPTKVTGSIEDIDLGTGTSTDKVAFTGIKSGDNLNVQFNGKKPVIGDNSQWTNSPWIIKKVNGKETLNIQFLAKNYDTNKWENSNYEFTPSN